MPTTVNKALEVPTTGSLPGTWGSAALNPDFAAIDGMLGGFQTVALTSGTTTLSVPGAFVATPSAGPTQSQNALLTFSGTLAGNCTIVFPMPGYYIVENLCVVGAFVVKLQSTAPGNVICAPPGEAVHVFNDGTNMRYVNLGRVGSPLSLTTASTPAWITNCTVPPYLLADGSTFNAVTYPTLAVLLGGTTLPDLRGRSWANMNGGTGRITTAGSGIDGNTLLSAGGEETNTLTTAKIPAHTHTASVTDPGHTHQISTQGGSANGSVVSGFGVNAVLNALSQAANSNTTGISVTNANAGGSEAHNNMQPTCIGGITLIRAG